MITIIPLTVASCVKLEGIDREWPAENVAAFAARPAFVGYWAEYLSDPAGFIMGWAVDDVAEIIQISVGEKRRRSGIGATLLKYFLNMHASRGCHLEVQRDNTGAIKLYQRFGFCVEGVRHGYYLSDSGGGDAVIMRLDTPSPES
jgi:ribosomal-protein-alanine N-acetyltransferase